MLSSILLKHFYKGINLKRPFHTNKHTLKVKKNQLKYIKGFQNNNIVELTKSMNKPLPQHVSQSDFLPDPLGAGHH